MSETINEITGIVIEPSGEDVKITKPFPAWRNMRTNISFIKIKIL
jgi:hypothetical protein